MGISNSFQSTINLETHVVERWTIASIILPLGCCSAVVKQFISFFFFLVR